LAGIADALAAKHPDRALEVARSIASDEMRANALAAIARTVSRPAVADDALNAARVISRDDIRARALARIAATMPDADVLPWLADRFTQRLARRDDRA
jgi:hypothetical protein